MDYVGAVSAVHGHSGSAGYVSDDIVSRQGAAALRQPGQEIAGTQHLDAQWSRGCRGERPFDLGLLLLNRQLEGNLAGTQITVADGGVEIIDIFVLEQMRQLLAIAEIYPQPLHLLLQDLPPSFDIL